MVEQSVKGLSDAVRAAAHLTLLTALAPYQVNEDVILAFRKHFSKDDELIGALAWASFTTARRIGTWLRAPST